MALPAPTRTIPLGGVVQRFVNAPDGRWLYFLDTHNRKLARIDPEKAAVDKEIDTLSPGTKAFCLTPDGKTIYCCSDSNRIDVIDAGEFKKARTVVLDKGQPTGIAASNEGVVFLVGQKVEGDPFTSSNCLVVDLRKAAADQAKVMTTDIGTVCQFVEMLPNQRAVLFSGDRRVIACSLPSNPALFRSVSREFSVRDYFMPGRIVVSPDGRTVLHDAAVILSVSR
jgi:DNA-binding beta-propeller fold protein YncE